MLQRSLLSQADELAAMRESYKREFKLNDELQHELAAMREAVSKQADDQGLWFVAQTCAEAYLQQELRRLHEIIESKSSRTDKPEYTAEEQRRIDLGLEPNDICD